MPFVIFYIYFCFNLKNDKKVFNKAFLKPMASIRKEKIQTEGIRNRLHMKLGNCQMLKIDHIVSQFEFEALKFRK